MLTERQTVSIVAVASYTCKGFEDIETLQQYHLVLQAYRQTETGSVVRQIQLFDKDRIPRFLNLMSHPRRRGAVEVQSRRSF